MSVWSELRATYEAALAAEDDLQAEQYRLAGITPEMHALPIGPERSAWVDRLDKAIDVEIERLSDLRYQAEDALMSCPSPDATAFAFKFLVAHGGGRDANGWDTMLETEAERFARRPEPASDAAWREAEARIAEAVDKVGRAEGDVPSDVLDELCAAENGLVALQPADVLQAIRRLEVALRDGPLHGVDEGPLFEDAKRLAAEAIHG